MGESRGKKWGATVTQVIEAPIDKVWAIVADFGGLHKHFPKIFDRGDIVEGEDNKVGAVRDVVRQLTEDTAIKCKERLVLADDQNHKTSYSMEDNIMGWTNYSGHVAAQSVEKNQTQVDWSYEVDPIRNMNKEEYEQGMNEFFNAILTDVKELTQL